MKLLIYKKYSFNLLILKPIYVILKMVYSLEHYTNAYNDIFLNFRKLVLLLVHCISQEIPMTIYMYMYIVHVYVHCTCICSYVHASLFVNCN